MLKRIYSFLSKNLTNALRDNIILYGALFPILLAFVMNIFITDAQDMKLTVAIDKNVEQRVIDGFRNYAEVELFNNKSEVQDRVEKNDDIAGIVKLDDQYVVLLEGNESGEAEEIASALMDLILTDKPTAEYRHLSLGKTNSALKDISGALLLLSAILIGGYIVGFGIVDEKETKAIKALSVSPLTAKEFVTSHIILCLVMSIALGVISSLILVGTSVNYMEVVVSIIATIGVGIALAFILGALADNLISAIAVVKFEVLVFMGVPMASLFTPDKFHWLYYIFPNYWAFQSYLNIFNGNNQPVGFRASTLIAFGFSIFLIIVLTPMLKHRLKLR